jgi:hypothetical protein
MVLVLTCFDPSPAGCLDQTWWNQATESMSAQAMCWPRHASDAFPWCSLAA